MSPCFMPRLRIRELGDLPIPTCTICERHASIAPSFACRTGGGLNLTAFGDATSLFNIDGDAIVAVNAEHEHTAKILFTEGGTKANHTG